MVAESYNSTQVVRWFLREDAILRLDVKLPITADRLLEIAELVRQIDVILRRRREIVVPQERITVPQKVEGAA